MMDEQQSDPNSSLQAARAVATWIWVVLGVILAGTLVGCSALCLTSALLNNHQS